MRGYADHVWNGPLLTVDIGRDMKVFAAKTKRARRKSLVFVCFLPHMTN